MHVTIRSIGNSQGVVIPKSMLAQLGLVSEADIAIEGDAIVLRKPTRRPREGWAEAAQAVVQNGEDGLVLGEFSNSADEDLTW